jgi:hypothetical protein
MVYYLIDLDKLNATQQFVIGHAMRITIFFILRSQRLEKRSRTESFLTPKGPRGPKWVAAKMGHVITNCDLF